MAVYAAMSAVGITAGVLLGGILTGMLSWRWVFFINVPIGLAVLVGTGALVEWQSLGRPPGMLLIAAVVVIAAVNTKRTQGAKTSDSAASA